MLLVVDSLVYQAKRPPRIFSLEDLIVVKIDLVYSVVSACAIHLSSNVLSKLSESWRITCLNSFNKGIQFLVNLDIVLCKLGFKAFLADLTAEVISDRFSHLVLV